jgi:mannose-6-phosphate isomerase-like protein (cupin superfamily)
VAYKVVDAGDVELREGVRGIRAALGVKAFGINQFELPADASSFQHSEAESHQDEVYIVIAGSGTMSIDGEEVELAPGRFVYVSPEATRQLHAGPGGLTYVAVGAPHEAPYHPRGFF